MKPWTLVSAARLAAKAGRVGREELGIDARRLLINGVSRMMPPLAMNRARTATLRALGVRVGERSLIMGPLRITGPGAADLLQIGDEALITGPLSVDLGASVSIGARVHVGHDVLLLTLDHEIGPPHERCGRLVSAPIRIGDGSWIGSRVTVLPGVTIGPGSVVAAGAVVTRDVEPDTMVGGVPARVIRSLKSVPPGRRVA